MRCPNCSNELEADTRFCPFDGTPVAHLGQSSGTALQGMVVDGRYRLDELLGRGGMATVYRAHSLPLGEDVALKVLRRELTTGTRAIARFAREARAASRIHHQNVVRVLDFGYAAEGFYFLVMELLRGSTLDEVIGEGRMPIARAVHVLAQIAAGMARAHSMGVIHRDLKPENVLVLVEGDNPGLVKVVDFGLARAHHMEEAQLTQTGEVFGTPEYMAPEQWAGLEADARTDVYAWGLIAHEVLSGTPAFVEDSLPKLMRAHVSVPPPPLGDIVPSVPPPILQLIDAALAKDRDARPASFDVVLAQLAQTWQYVPAPSIRVSYASTAAAPPPRGLDAPTEIDLSMVTSPTHAPAVHEEIQRLRRVRQRRLRELAHALWGSRVPPHAAELQARIVERELDVDRSAAELALAEAELEAAEERERAGDAELRVRLVEASLRRAELADSLPYETTQVRWDVNVAQQALAEHRGAHRRTLSRLRDVLIMRLNEIAALERTLGPLYEQLAAWVHRAAAGRPDLRAHIEAFGRVDGAIASYQALLDRLAIRAARAGQT